MRKIEREGVYRGEVFEIGALWREREREKRLGGHGSKSPSPPPHLHLLSVQFSSRHTGRQGSAQPGRRHAQQAGAGFLPPVALPGQLFSKEGSVFPISCCPVLLHCAGRQWPRAGESCCQACLPMPSHVFMPCVQAWCSVWCVAGGGKVKEGRQAQATRQKGKI